MSYSVGTRQIKYLLVTLVALVISDGLITQFLVRKGVGYEGNPFLATFVGEWTFLAIKVLGAFLCAFILWDIYKKWANLGRIAIPFFVIIYTGIVFWNISIFFMYRG